MAKSGHFHFVWVILLLTPTLAISQDFRPGYIIKNTSDTVRGFVAYQHGKKASEEVLFKPSKNEKPTRFSPDQINAYGITDLREYVAVVLPADLFIPGKVFIQRLATGPMSLYQFNNIFLIKKDTLVTLPIPIGKNIQTSRGMVFHETKRYVGLLNLQLQGSPYTADKTKYTEADLSNLVNDYNRFKGHVIPRNQGMQPAFRFYPQVFAGFMQSHLTVDYLPKNTFSASNTVTGGIGVDVTAPRINDRLFVSLESFYTKNTYQGYFKDQYNGNERRQDIYLNLSYLKVPFGFRYNLKGAPSTPYIRLGISYTFILTSSARTLQDLISNGIVQSSEPAIPYIFRNALGIWGAVGYQKSFSTRFAVFGEFRFERDNGFIGTEIVPSSSHINYNAIVGIRY